MLKKYYAYEGLFSMGKKSPEWKPCWHQLKRADFGPVWSKYSELELQKFTFSASYMISYINKKLQSKIFLTDPISNLYCTFCCLTRM